MATASVQTGLQLYLRQINESPLLSADEEKQLARRIIHHQDMAAGEQGAGPAGMAASHRRGRRPQPAARMPAFAGGDRVAVRIHAAQRQHLAAGQGDGEREDARGDGGPGGREHHRQDGIRAPVRTHRVQRVERPRLGAAGPRSGQDHGQDQEGGATAGTHGVSSGQDVAMHGRPFQNGDVPAR